MRENDREREIQGVCVYEKKVCKYEFGCAHVRVCVYASEKKCVRKREI